MSCEESRAILRRSLTLSRKSRQFRRARATRCRERGDLRSLDELRLGKLLTVRCGDGGDAEQTSAPRRRPVFISARDVANRVGDERSQAGECRVQARLGLEPDDSFAVRRPASPLLARSP